MSNSSIQTITDMIAGGQYPDAYELCATQLASTELSAAEKEQLSLLSIQCIIFSIPLVYFFDRHIEDENGEPFMKHNEKYSTIVDILETAIFSLSSCLGRSKKRKIEEYSATIHRFAQQAFLLNLDKYITNNVNTEADQVFVSYFSGYCCLVFTIVLIFDKLAKKCSINDFAIGSLLEETELIIADKFCIQSDNLVDIIKQKASDFPYFALDDGKEVMFLYWHAAHLIREAIRYVSRSSSVDDKKLVFLKKKLVNINCDLLNIITVSKGQQFSCVVNQERRNEIYTEILSSEKEIQQYEGNYTHPVTRVEFYSSASQGGGCYIATAVYGSYDCPQVWTLRRYRDYTLAKTRGGRVFIKAYYAISPTLIKWFGHTRWFKKMWQSKLDRMVTKLQANGVESTPYKD